MRACGARVFVIYCMTMSSPGRSPVVEPQLWIAITRRDVARQACNLHRSLRPAVVGHELDMVW